MNLLINKMMNTMKNLTTITIVAAAVFALASCENKNRVDVKRDTAALPFELPASLKLETIVAKDFIKHRNYEAMPFGVDGLASMVEFTYPAEYSDIEVLRTLQRKFLGYTLGEEAAAAFPQSFIAPVEEGSDAHVKRSLWSRLWGKKETSKEEDAITTRNLVSDWIKEYLRNLLAEWNAEFDKINLKDKPIERWVRERQAHVLFANNALIQLQTYRLDSMNEKHAPRIVSAHLFDLATAKEYSQADIFNADASEKIRDLIIPELIEYWETVHALATETIINWERTANLSELQALLEKQRERKPPKRPRKQEIPLPERDEAGNVKFDKEAVWTLKTAFAVTHEGIMIAYSDRELGSYELGSPAITIPYAAILPYLREGTPVHDLAEKK